MHLANMVKHVRKYLNTVFNYVKNKEHVVYTVC